ncbi:MAG: AbrB/MazE/SpoVT family DNA-binding domain-containing protein [Bryobacterales bacterium]|nr:AbrB/MazE/SpoVT family DNA-binding domain-containing protein [Bryobacterales bacterium]
MKLKVDSAGRLVVPESIRERLGFEPGVEFEAIETPEGLLLRRAANETRILPRWCTLRLQRTSCRRRVAWFGSGLRSEDS